TNPVPNRSESGMFLRGSRTSPAVKVMLFQASAENSEPTCPTQIAINIPSAPPVAETTPTNGRSDVIGETAAGVQNYARVTLSATKIPSTTSAKSDSVFADVKTFWINLPNDSPRVFTIVRNTMITIATNCWVERLTA